MPLQWRLQDAGAAPPVVPPAVPGPIFCTPLETGAHAIIDRRSKEGHRYYKNETKPMFADSKKFLSNRIISHHS